MKPIAKQANSFSGRLFDTSNVLFMILLCIVTLYPFLFIVTLSLSPADVSFVEMRLFPKKVTLDNFKAVLSNEYVISGFAMSMYRTVFGTLLTLLVTTMLAYVLSKRYFPHRTFWIMIIVFTMFFQGGLIPQYLLVKELGLINKIWALVLPNLIYTFQLIIARTFFMNIPEELEESAKIDGANEITVLFRIVLPISKPILATLGLWTAVHLWNEWFHSMIFTTDSYRQVLQVVMRRIVLEGDGLDSMVSADMVVITEAVKAATVMVTMLPIMFVYPFAQKYFVKGMMIGSLKG